MKLVSIVAPVYNEKEGILGFHKELSSSLRFLEEKYRLEIIYVNDGSSDGSGDILENLANKDNRITVIHFSRNFGHQYAITAGMDYANGDCVVTMDADLQDPPVVILDLIKSWEKGGEVVYAKRKKRQDGAFKKFTAYWFYRILRTLTTVDIPSDVGDFRLIDKKVVMALRGMKEKDPFVRGLVAFVGFRNDNVLFDRSKRMAGETKYPLKKMIKLAVSGIVSFSSLPLSLAYYFAVVPLVLFALSIAQMATGRVLISDKLLLPLFGLCISLILVSLGLVGIYIDKIYKEALNRPRYIIDRIYNAKNKKA